MAALIPKCVNGSVYQAARAFCRQEILEKGSLELFQRLLAGPLPQGPDRRFLRVSRPCQLGDGSAMTHKLIYSWER